ncbi:MAG: feruloyl-CoA synthase [Caldilineaceae bacterium]
MKSNAPFRQTHFGPIAARKTVRTDGSILVHAEHGLDAYPDRLTDWLLHWAAATPDRTFIARRNPHNEWVRLSYAETLRRVRILAQALLDRGLSTERTVAILSGNSLEHQLLSLAAMHVGIPYAPISPPYALLSKDFGKLRRTLELMTPGLIFVQDGTQYERALAAVLPRDGDIELVVVDNPVKARPSTAFADLLATSATPAVDVAAAAVGLDTVAKVLFTSGSTSLPKGVINTNRMICANLQQIFQTLPFIGEEPPVIVDWLPWNHTFGGNHNIGLILANGGAFYMDEGKPTPDGIGPTVANLREIAPTMYFNVPRGLEELLPYLQREAALRTTFFSRLKMLFYAGAALPQHVWDGLEEIAAQTCGERIPIITGLGMTESGPSAMFAHWPGSYSGLLGVPVPGLELKLTPVEGKLEARYRGPNVTPGYWRQPELNAVCFDEEGFFRTGDAIKFVDENNPNKGLLFDGRLAEDFKLTTGTWVSVGVLRAQIVKLGAPIVREAVITGHNRDYVGALLFLHLDACQALAHLPAHTPPVEVYAHPTIHTRIQQLLDEMAAQATGISNRLERVTIAVEPPSIDVGEITDKGSFNQRAILEHRVALVKELYTNPKPAHTFERETVFPPPRTR